MLPLYPFWNINLNLISLLIIKKQFYANLTLMLPTITEESLNDLDQEQMRPKILRQSSSSSSSYCSSSSLPRSQSVSVNSSKTQSANKKSNSLFSLLSRRISPRFSNSEGGIEQIFAHNFFKIKKSQISDFNGEKERGPLRGEAGLARHTKKSVLNNLNDFFQCFDGEDIVSSDYLFRKSSGGSR